MGRRTGTDDPRFVTHSSYYDSMKQISDIMIIENVPEYSEEIARQHLVGWSTESVVVDPRVLGVPASRARLYILAFNEATVKRRRDVCFGCTALCCNKHLMTTKSHWFGVGFKSNQVFQVVDEDCWDPDSKDYCHCWHVSVGEATCIGSLWSSSTLIKIWCLFIGSWVLQPKNIFNDDSDNLSVLLRQGIWLTIDDWRPSDFLTCRSIRGTGGAEGSVLTRPCAP